MEINRLIYTVINAVHLSLKKQTFEKLLQFSKYRPKAKNLIIYQKIKLSPFTILNFQENTHTEWI